MVEDSDFNVGALRSQLDDEEASTNSEAPADGSTGEADQPVPSVNKYIPPALQGFVPHTDKIKLPTTWHDVRKTFGSHLDWAFIIAFCGLLTWAYVRYVRPKLPKPEGEESMVLDENDVTASLHLGPGEELFFSDCETGQDGTVGFYQWFGGSNRVSKIAVTSRRVIAQFRESTFCGTCQLGAKEECWPVENVSKVSVISGEFNGLTIPQLWSTAYVYFFITLLFDLFGGFVKDNIHDFFGEAANDEIVSKIIFGINLSLGIICNLLFIVSIIYALALMWMIVFPTSIIKVYLTSNMEEEGHPVQNCCQYCCTGTPNSRPSEAFTFATRNSYKAYHAIMSARSGAGNPFSEKNFV